MTTAPAPVQLALAGILDKRPAVTAVHEAGHAVACCAFGGEIDHATIIPNGRSLGHVSGPPLGRRAAIRSAVKAALAAGADPEEIMRLAGAGQLQLPDLTRDELTNSIRVCVAGPLAEFHYRRIRIPHYSEVDWTDGDYEVALKHAERLCGGLTQPAMRHVWRLQRETAGFVRGQWRAIDRLAQQLLKRQYMTGSEIAEVLAAEPLPFRSPSWRTANSKQ